MILSKLSDARRGIVAYIVDCAGLANSTTLLSALDEITDVDLRENANASEENTGRLSPRHQTPESSSSEESESSGEDDDVDLVGQENVTHDFYAPRRINEAHLSRLIGQSTAASRMPRALWNSLQRMPGQTFIKDSFPSAYLLNKMLAEEARLDIQYLDCCINGCMAFTRDYKNDLVCFSCLQRRYDTSGKARQRFTYISPINRLRAQNANKTLSERLKYPHVRTKEEGKYQDIWDGSHIASLRNHSVRWGGVRVEGAGRYFADDTQMALGLAMDGLPCWKRSKLDCWPILLTNYSLSPTIRTKREFQICCGLIPGTRDQVIERKVDINSFLWPFIEDLKKLATHGVTAKRWEGGRLVDYKMKAHLVVISGDMPAISKLMSFKSIGAQYPCRWCTMPAIRAGPPGSESGKYYLTTKCQGLQNAIDYHHLPVRTHATIIQTVSNIRACTTVASRDEMQRVNGINDQSVLSIIGSINFPWSFSADTMHLLFENIMKELLGLWEGTHKALMVTGEERGRRGEDSGEGYVIAKSTWDDIDREVSDSNRTVPARIARRLGSISKRGFWTAETYSYLLSHLGPIVLKGRLPTVYYDHYVRLSQISKLLSQVEITEDELDFVKRGLVQWVIEFEKLYFKYESKYISFCTNPIHVLLHVAECIERLGPPSHYWCFSMERFGGWLKRQVAFNRKHPIEALNNRIHQLMSMLSRPDAAVEWRSTVTGQKDTWTADVDPANGAIDVRTTGILFEKEPRPSQITREVRSTVASFLSAREWTPEGQRTGTFPKYQHTDIADPSINLCAWRGYRSSGEDGFECWRTDQSQKESEKRDTSWALYRMFEDPKPRSFNVELAEGDWDMRPTFGQVIMFLSFSWKGEQLSVAVLRGYETENWLSGYDEGDGAQLLIRPKDRLEVVEVSALETVAGRIRLKHGAVTKEVVFEISSGCLAAEMFQG